MPESPDSLFNRLAAQADDSPPPVHQWHPASTQDIGMQVTRDGTWWYQGSPVTRHGLVRLFSRILRREGNDYYLVTPVEKVRLAVEVAPLLAVRMETQNGAQGPEIAFETNVGDIVVADAAHPVTMRGEAAAPLPVIEVRDGIEALIVRSVYYELVASAELITGEAGEGLVLSSRGQNFELGAV